MSESNDLAAQLDADLSAQTQPDATPARGYDDGWGAAMNAFGSELVTEAQEVLGDGFEAFAQEAAGKDVKTWMATYRKHVARIGGTTQTTEAAPTPGPGTFTSEHEVHAAFNRDEIDRDTYAREIERVTGKRLAGAPAEKAPARRLAKYSTEAALDRAFNAGDVDRATYASEKKRLTGRDL